MDSTSVHHFEHERWSADSCHCVKGWLETPSNMLYLPPVIFTLSPYNAFYGRDVSNSLFGLHAFTGCNMTSVFKGKEKVTAMKFVEKKKKTRNKHFKVVFMKLKESWQINEGTLSSIKEFACIPNGNKQKC